MRLRTAPHPKPSSGCAASKARLSGHSGGDESRGSFVQDVQLVNGVPVKRVIGDPAVLVSSFTAREVSQ